MRNNFQITEYCHLLVKQFGAEEPGFCIDATMGNGGDTVFLAQIVGKEGRVLAFDIQETAVSTTKKALEDAGVSESADLIHDGHENMDKYAEPSSADIVMFNFGYLPGGDHSLSTNAESSLTAVRKGLDILKKGGIMTLCIYSGGDTGFEEKEALLDFVTGLDQKKYIVISHEYINRKNNPPLPVLIKKL